MFQLIQKFFTLGNERIKQLEEQDKIDNKLIILNNYCPQTLNEYLIIMRKYNLFLSRNIYESSLTSIIEKSVNQIEIINEHNKSINELLKKEQLVQCNEMIKIIEDIRNNIK